MATAVVLHSVLGLRPGVLDTAERLRAAGHVVHTPDLNDGRVFDDYAAASSWLQSVGGIGELVRRTRESVEELPATSIYIGFSNGGVGAELLAATRPGACGAVLLAASAPLPMLGVDRWPPTVPVQVHYAKDDPFRDQSGVDAFALAVRESGAEYEYFEYPVSGHLITDASLPAEHDPGAAELIAARISDFVARVDE